MKMNVVYEIAEIAEEGSAVKVSIVYSGSDSTCAVSGLGAGILEAAKAQGRKVVDIIDSVRISSDMIIKPAAGKVFCHAGVIVEGEEIPKPWEVAETTPIIVEIDKQAAKDQDLLKLLLLQEAGCGLCQNHSEANPDKTYSLHWLDKLRVSTFRNDQWNQLRNTTAYLVKI
jgi:hypothetical protein